MNGWSAGQVGYCSNVHAVRDLAGLRASIERHFQDVRRMRRLATQDSGLWVCAQAAAELQHKLAHADFMELLEQSGLRLTSLNGFPYGQFHEGAVKAEVYLPDWSMPERLTYSLNLARLLARSLPPGCNHGVISSVPLGYAATWSPELQQRAENQLRQLTAWLARLHRETGKKIVFCLEMEPDCVLETTDQALAFFRHWQASDPHHHYLALCFDVCHQAVMFEDCYQSLQRLHQAEVPIGKIQLSNALICRLPAGDDVRYREILATLREFSEITYLHQVKARDHHGNAMAWADLPAALDDCARQPGRYAELRIHFHVPLFSEHFLLPELGGSQFALAQTFDYLAEHDDLRPVLEVETYSWGVLPASLRPGNEQEQLQGISAELYWVEAQLLQRGLIDVTVQEAVADASV